MVGFRFRLLLLFSKYITKIVKNSWKIPGNPFILNLIRISSWAIFSGFWLYCEWNGVFIINIFLFSSSMEPLKSVRRIIALLGVYSFDEYTANWSKVGRFLFVSAILVGNTGASLSGIVYIYKQEISVHTLCLVTGMGNMAIMMMVALIQRDKITGIVDHLLDAYKKCEMKFWQI